MPCDYKRYPKNWKEIRTQILKRAKNTCEWCGVWNHDLGYRDKEGVFHNLTLLESEMEYIGKKRYYRNSHDRLIRITEIVLTIAHLGTPHADGTPGDKHDKMDCRPENLAALCQRCHLGFDLDDHITNAMRSRDQKRGQLALSLDSLAGEAE